MENEGLISVVIPIFNMEKYLRKCLDSVCNQTYTKLEILLIDDGSTDQSSKIYRAYQRNDNRIKIFCKENGGLSSARNYGIERATGQYIAFVDSDDYIHPRMFEILTNNIKENQSQIAICNFETIYEQGDTVSKRENEQIDDKVYTDSEVMQLLWMEGRITVVTWNKLYVRSLFNSIKFPKGKIHEDEFIIHHLLIQCKRVSVVNKVLYYYLKRNNSITSNIGWENIQCSIEAFQDRIDLFLKVHDKLNMFYAIERLERYIIEHYKIVKARKQKKRILRVFRQYLAWYKKTDIKFQRNFILFGVCPQLYYMKENIK